MSNSCGQGNIALGQINTTPGDLAGNARKIMTALHQAEAACADLLILPELALMGYPPRDLIVRFPFLVRENQRWLNAIAERTGETFVLVGFVEERPNPYIGRPYFNAMAVLGEGRIQGIVRKRLIPAYQEFEDMRQFESGPYAENVYTIHGRRYGLSICEDMWNDADFFEQSLYPVDPIADLMRQTPEILINISASPSRTGKEATRQKLCAHLVKKYGLPLIYMNQVGSVDELSFDGASQVYDPQGCVIAQGKSFAEDFLIVNPFPPSQPPPAGGRSPMLSEESDISEGGDLERIYNVLVQGIRDYFHKAGFQRAVLGLSGGLDSSVTAVLLAHALGPANILGLSMPSRLTPDENRSDALQLAKNLGIQWQEVPIMDITTAFSENLESVQQSLESAWGDIDSYSNAQDNIQAISRATILRQLGNAFRALPVATSDKSEFYLGYATVNGDMSGALAPLGDVPKTKVRALAAWLNQREGNQREQNQRALSQKGVKDCIIPEAIITKPSGADLQVDPKTGQLITAESALMPYAFADEVIWRIETLHQGLSDMLEIPFEYEQDRSLSSEQKADQKSEWLHKFFNRMSKAVFKWFIAPPILIVENGSLAKTDYHHPIVSNRVSWAGHTDQTIQDWLDAL